MPVRVDFHGIGKVKLILSNASHAMAEEVFRASQRTVPVDTGRLKRSGRLTRRHRKSTISYNTKYAGIVEQRQRYLIRALNDANAIRRAAVDAMREGLR